MTASPKPRAKSKPRSNGSSNASFKKKARKKAAGFNRDRYATLLADALPMVITADAEYDRTISEIQSLLRKGEAGLSPEEDRLLDLLSTLAEDWEEAHHPIPETPGYRVLRHYMQIRGLRQVDLQPILGPRRVISAIVNGKRSITAEQAKQLGSLFGVSPAVFG
jgi:HTH-type transcriptional regulator/antitoxin HigA